MNIMIHYNKVTKENRQEHNQSWSQITDHPYKTLVAGRFGSGETNGLVNLIHHNKSDDFIDKISMHVSVFHKKASRSWSKTF